MDKLDEYRMIRDNIPIMNDDGIGLKFPRCGMCNLNNIRDWDAHSKTEEHISLINKFNILRKVTDGHIDYKELVRASHIVTLKEVLDFVVNCSEGKDDIDKLNDIKTANRRKVEDLLGKR